MEAKQEVGHQRGEMEVDHQDWRFSLLEYERWVTHIKASLGEKWEFTIDICADNGNAKTSRFHQDVLQAGLKGEQFYCCPPFTCPITPIARILEHIRDEHTRHQGRVQGMLVIPWWEKHSSHSEILKHPEVFQVLHVYPKGTKLFVAASGIAPKEGTNWPTAVVWVKGEGERPFPWSGIPKRPSARMSVTWNSTLATRYARIAPKEPSVP